MRLRRFLKYWLPLLIWLGVIFLGSTNLMSAEHTSRFIVPFLRWLNPEISLSTIAAIHLALRKLAHLAEYAVLAVLLWRALHVTLTSTRMTALAALAFMACATFAASDEFHQSFIASRTPSPADVMFDICGVLIGLAICRMLAARRLNRR